MSQPEQQVPPFAHPPWADQVSGLRPVEPGIPQPPAVSTEPGIAASPATPPPTVNSWPMLPEHNQQLYPHQELANIQDPLPAAATDADNELDKGTDWAGLFQILAWPTMFVLFFATGTWWVLLAAFFIVPAIAKWLKQEQKRRRKRQ